MTLEQVCEEIAGVCLDVRPGEKVLLIRGAGRASGYHEPLRRAVARRGAAMLLAEMPPLPQGGAAPAEVEAAMCQANVVVLATPRIFPHSSRRKAAAAGARILSLCTVTDEMLLRAAAVDHRALAAQTARVAERIRAASVWRLQAPAGTDLTATVAGRRVVVLDGMAREAGTASGLPAGVVAVTPVPGTARGRVVVDGSIDGFGLVGEAPTLIVESGAVVEISGGEAGRFLRERFASADAGACCLCEMGTGTNPLARYTGNLVEDERVRGSAHVGFGGNLHLGGEHASALHFDATVRRPSIFLDGEPLVLNGEPVPQGPEPAVRPMGF